MAQVKKITKKNIFLLISSSLFVLGVIFFSLAIQKYQVLTSSRATGTDECAPYHTAGETWCDQTTGTRMKCSSDYKLVPIEQIWCSWGGTEGDLMKCGWGNGYYHSVVHQDCGGLGCTGTQCNGGGGGTTPTATPGGGTAPTATPGQGGTGTWNQCNASGSNKPCGSCSVTDITVGAGGAASTTFGCQLLCNPGNCPSGTYQINDTSWFWCSNKDGASCTQGNSDLIANVHNTSSVGSLTISDASPNATNNGFSWSFTIPNWTGCGRVQTDVQINAQGVSVAGLTKSFGSDCATAPTNTPPPGTTNTPTTPPNNTNTPTTPPGTTNTPTTPPNNTNTPTTPPTNTPTHTPTAVPPTSTPTKTPTNTPTSTPTKTATPVPTSTLVPTNTPVPTVTPVPTNTPIPPTPTTVVIAEVPTATPTPVKQLTVDNQKPGITPWALILVPIGLLLLGLLL